MKNMKIYLADDEMSIRESLKVFLESEGFEVFAFETGDALFEKFKESEANLVILDVMMPGSSGFEICTKIREVSTVPIIMLTARDSDLDYVMGLKLGSDDYLTKPFSAMALVMKVRALFRRMEFDMNADKKMLSDKEDYLDNIEFADIKLDRKSKKFYRMENDRQIEISLTPTEYEVVQYFLQKIDTAISRDELLEHVWGYSAEIETRATDDTIRRLRKKIADTKVSIESVWGFGFRMIEKKDV